MDPFNPDDFSANDNYLNLDFPDDFLGPDFKSNNSIPESSAETHNNPDFNMNQASEQPSMDRASEQPSMDQESDITKIVDYLMIDFESLDPLAQALQDSGINLPVPHEFAQLEPELEPPCRARACAETIMDLTQELENTKLKLERTYNSGYKRMRKENRDLKAQVERERAKANYWKRIALSHLSIRH